MDETIVITGCAGFIGSHVTDHFLANGYTVVGYDAFTYAGKVENLKFAVSHPKFTLVEGSINDTKLLEESCGQLHQVLRCVPTDKCAWY